MRTFSITTNGNLIDIQTIIAGLEAHIYEICQPASADEWFSSVAHAVCVSREELKETIQLLHDSGIQFNLCLDATCHDGLDFNAEKQKKFQEYVLFLADAGCDSITLANPHMIDLAQSVSTPIEIVVSSYGNVTDPLRVDRYCSYGLKRIILHPNVYRHFEMLETLRQWTDVSLELIVNQACLYQCDSFITHANLDAHSNHRQPKDPHIRDNVRYPERICSRLRQTEPVELLTSSFIRPEDLSFYEARGYERFIIAGTHTSSEWIRSVLAAYVKGSFDGNIFDLFSTHFSQEDKKYIANRALDGCVEEIGSSYDGVQFYSKARTFLQSHMME